MKCSKVLASQEVVTTRPNGVIVDTDKPIDGVVEEVVDHIVGRLTAKG